MTKVVFIDNLCSLEEHDTEYYTYKLEKLDSSNYLSLLVYNNNEFNIYDDEISKVLEKFRSKNNKKQEKSNEKIIFIFVTRRNKTVKSVSDLDFFIVKKIRYRVLDAKKITIRNKSYILLTIAENDEEIMLLLTKNDINVLMQIYRNNYVKNHRIILQKLRRFGLIEKIKKRIYLTSKGIAVVEYLYNNNIIYNN